MPPGPPATIAGKSVVSTRPVSGGCIDDTREIRLEGGGRCFLKLASNPAAAARLAAEADGLARLAPHIRTPAVLETATTGSHGWLALEWLDLRPPAGRAESRAFGAALAALHRNHGTRHGLDRDNFLGPTPQDNRPLDDWPAFFAERRIRPLLAMLARTGIAPDEPETLRLVARRLHGHHPPPALLHGDLWSGNHAIDATSGAPVVFDPACYHGDPETDLAMLECFGPRLDDAFWDGYGPPPPDREHRRPAYDLHHALNHLLIFGPGYLGMVRNRLDLLR